MALVAAGVAGLTIVFSLCAWMMLGSSPAYVDTRAQVLDPPRISVSAFASRWSAENAARAAPATTASISSSFNTRFAARSPTPPAPPTRSLQPPSTFSARFSGGSTPPVLPSQFVLASVPAAAAPITLPTPAAVAAPAPHAAARALIARTAPKRPAAAPVRVASLGDAPIRTAYAPNPGANIDAALPKEMTPRDPAPKDAAANPDLSRTAIYDLTAHTVYLPNGRRLEAHSGLGEHMDDLGAINLRNLGPTPPGIYDLTMRERRFHGVEAIRLNPIDDGKMYGRDGILAHPYMLGPNGQSNGCVSFKDYDEFLAAFRRGEFNRLVVVERLDGEPPGGQSATGWFADKLKGFRGLFGQS
jgi:hypothetical protein